VVGWWRHRFAFREGRPLELTVVAQDAYGMFATRTAARAYLFEFIEVFYNRQRHQTGLGHRTTPRKKR